MEFHELEIAGALLVRPEPKVDTRGSFSRLFCGREFAEHGLMSNFQQESVSYSAVAGTLRGFHLQVAPHEETKLVSCVSGSAFDVILDVRRSSPTYGRYATVTLRARTWEAVYIPAGCAHAVQTLEDGTEMLYRISVEYVEAAAAGYRWDSPALKVPWPIDKPIVSVRDRALPLFSPD